jgi:hypothetical protein
LHVQIANVVNSEREQNELKTPYQHPFVNVVEMINKGQNCSISSLISANVTASHLSQSVSLRRADIASCYKHRQMGQYFS